MMINTPNCPRLNVAGTVSDSPSEIFQSRR